MRNFIFRILTASLVVMAGFPAWSQTCQGPDEVQEPVRSALDTAAQQAYDLASRGDVNGLKANAAPFLQSNFTGITAAVNDNKDLISRVKAQLRTLVLLEHS